VYKTDGDVPLRPTASKYLQEKWDKAAYDMHRKRVMTAKPVVNTGPPKTYSYLTPKQKNRKVTESLRTLEIQRENDRLREKISYIMSTPGKIDNWNFYEKKRSVKFCNNRVRTIGQCKPFYSVRAWHEDWLKTTEVMERISHYPRDRANQQKVSFSFFLVRKTSNKEEDAGTQITLNQMHYQMRKGMKERNHKIHPRIQVLNK
uniref:CFAP97 domain containing 2 n=1 Tax=Oreochromis niloticus TaxID=8128 RepID=A0A669DVH7_ORENI